MVIFKWRKQLLSIGNCPKPGGVNEYPATGILKTSEVIVTRTGDTTPSWRPSTGSMHKKPSFLGISDTNRPVVQSNIHRSSGRIDPNEAALKYCKCAMLFFLALIITWVPSTVNRIYTIVRPDDVNFGLNLAAALVLPLQGFWNAVIYMVTSTFAVKSLWEDIRIVFQHLFLRPKLTQTTRSRVIPQFRPETDRASKTSSNSICSGVEPASSQRDLVSQTEQDHEH